MFLKQKKRPPIYKINSKKNCGMCSKVLLNPIETQTKTVFFTKVNDQNKMKEFGGYDQTPMTTCGSPPSFSMASPEYFYNTFETFVDATPQDAKRSLSFLSQSPTVSIPIVHRHTFILADKTYMETMENDSCDTFFEKKSPFSLVSFNYDSNDMLSVTKTIPSHETHLNESNSSHRDAFELQTLLLDNLHITSKPFRVHWEDFQKTLYLETILKDILFVYRSPKTCFWRSPSFIKYEILQPCSNQTLPFKKISSFSSPRPCVPLEYTEFRKLRYICINSSSSSYLDQKEIKVISILSFVSQITYNENNSSHEKLLFQYWELAQNALRSLNDSYYTTPVYGINSTWLLLGFQGTNPRTDFRGGGILSLACMVYFAKNYNSVFKKILKDTQLSHSYPFSAAFINIALLLVVCLQLNPFATHCPTGRYPTLSRKAYKNFAKLLTYTNQHTFEELFCCCCIAVHEHWLTSKVVSNLLDFKKTLCFSQKRLVCVLESKPSNVLEFHKIHQSTIFSPPKTKFDEMLSPPVISQLPLVKKSAKNFCRSIFSFAKKKKNSPSRQNVLSNLLKSKR